MTMKNSSSGQELIDATQSAIIQVADKVAEIMEPVVDSSHAHGHGPFYQNPEFWVGMAFVFVVLMLAKPVSKIFSVMLKKRIDDIANRIDEAAKLKDDAQKVLAEYETKFQNAKKEANALLKKTQKQVDLLQKDSLHKLEVDMVLRQKEAEERINAAKDEAEKEIAWLVSEVVVGAVKNLLAQKLDEKAHDALIDDAIEKIA